MLHEHYPSPVEVDAWCRQLVGRADAVDFVARRLNMPTYTYQLGVRHTRGNAYVQFSSDAFDTFYGYWQPALGDRPAPLLVHLPGYGTEISAHPELVMAGFHVLHVSPLGYATPEGPNVSKRVNDQWPVLPDTVSSLGQRGYVEWLRDALVAVRWALGMDGVMGDRVSFFGSSQGGGTALLLASLLRDRGVRAVAADVPFLTNFALMARQRDRGAYDLALAPLEQMERERPQDVPAAWRAIGYIDTLCHAHRLTMPVLLTAGSVDTTTPPVSIRPLLDALPGTRSYTEQAGQGHAYTPPFIRLAAAWFGLYA